MRSSANYIDMTGMKCGRLLVLCRARVVRGEKPRWHCVCACGNRITTFSSQLRRKQTQSCGCLCVDRTKQANTIHGKKGTRIYRIWNGMLNRCRNPNSKDFARYGASGIAVCDLWKSFERFYEDMGEPTTIKHSIDRIDGYGNYEPGNCRWATPKQQANNRRSPRRVDRKKVREKADYKPAAKPQNGE